MKIIHIKLFKMKQITLVLASFLLLFITNTSFANEPSDYFAGDWKVLLKGTPSGDAEMVLHLERVDGKLTGEMRNEGMDPTKINSVDEKENSITVYYSTMGYDINISLTKVDDNNVKGSLMGMFDATAERIVE